MQLLGSSKPEGFYSYREQEPAVRLEFACSKVVVGFFYAFSYFGATIGYRLSDG